MLELVKAQLKRDLPVMAIGDTLSVSIRIREGSKERIQVFTGILIARKGRELSETFSLYRAAQGAGVERTFPLHSPAICKIERRSRGRVRKAKLYYLRGAVGKRAKVRQRIDRK